MHVLHIRAQHHRLAGTLGGRGLDAAAELGAVDGEEHHGLHAERLDHVERHRELGRLGALAAADVEATVFAEVEPNPGASTVERGAAALRTFGLGGTVVVPVGGGSSMDTAKALDLRAANDLAVWELEYDGPDLTPGRPVVAVPTTAGTVRGAGPFDTVKATEPAWAT